MRDGSYSLAASGRLSRELHDGEIKSDYIAAVTIGNLISLTTRIVMSRTLE